MRIREMQFGLHNPISNTFGMVRKKSKGVHQGWDLTAVPGTPVYAIRDGEIFVGYSNTYGHNITLKFSYQGKTYFAFYAHLQKPTISNVSSVAEGTVIGTTGTSGNARALNADERHLHFEIRTTEIVGSGLSNRIDPGEILGYQYYSSQLP